MVIKCFDAGILRIKWVDARTFSGRARGTQNNKSSLRRLIEKLINSEIYQNNKTLAIDPQNLGKTWLKVCRTSG